mgnify:FL=1
MRKQDIIIIVSTFVVVSMICAGIILGVLHFRNSQHVEEPPKQEDVLGANDNEENKDDEEQKEPEEEYTGPKIFTGNSRPYAVMIDNETAVKSHAGLNDAYNINQQ